MSHHDLHALVDRVREQRRHLEQEALEVASHRLDLPAAAEGQQLLCQLCGAAGRLEHEVEVALRLGVAGAQRGHLDRAHDPAEQVVEVVGDAARQLAYRLHLLGVVKLLLEPVLLGDVAKDEHHADDRPLAVADRRARVRDLAPAAVAGDERGVVG
jgi:hypothetical protein